MEHKVLNGNNIDLLKSYPDNYFDAIVTDPPYGLGEEPNAVELMKDWIDKGYHEISGRGFMGKEWDAFVPQPLFWKEAYRVLKHGGHVLSFFGTRTYDWGVMSMRFAGFEVRDCIQWLYGSGFPKSHNIGKAIDKLEGNEREVISEKKSGVSSRAYQSEERTTAGVHYETKGNSEWEGWGSALKPANEPIVLARKPLEKGLSIAENVLKYGTGGINIDGCRVNIDKNDPNHRHNPSEGNSGKNSIFGIGGHNGNLKTEGRFPANLILTHHPQCVCKGLKKVKSDGNFPKSQNTQSCMMSSKGKSLSPEKDFSDENGEETVEDWNCHEDCPIKILDGQSGISKTGDIKPHQEKGNGTIYGNGKGFFSNRDIRNVNFKGDSGGASRFFYVAKASKSERDNGLSGFEQKRSSAYGYEIGLGEKGEGMFKDRSPIKQNFHPTVKPVKLMQYLVRLITQPNGIVLDPFCGSGTTGIACKLEGFEFVGMEQDAEYSKIAQARIDNYQEEPEEKLEFIEEEENEDKPKQLGLF